jgi:stage V sporulation protein R
LINFKELEIIARDFGLDFNPVEFLFVDYKEICSLAAYSGFPNRYAHWRWGEQFEYLHKMHIYGLSNIYEMVIATDPVIAYLDKANSDSIQKMVITHVFGHAHFFKHNSWCSKANTSMIQILKSHEERINNYIEKYGIDEVEHFVTLCLAIEDLIDPTIFPKSNQQIKEEVLKIQVDKKYMDSYVNPQEYVEQQKEKLKAKKKEKKFESTQDILLFLAKNAPIDDWKQDILAMVREESQYFLSIIKTKIMNEGFAVYTHTTLAPKYLNDSDIIEFADHNSRVLSSSIFNPYKLGLMLLQDIELRWNKGRVGPEWDLCTDFSLKKNWDKKWDKGKEKIFEVVKLFDDVNFVDEFFTEDMCKEHKLFAYDYDKRDEQYKISSRDFEEVKQKFLFLLSNHGLPIIELVDDNYNNAKELFLNHRHENIPLHEEYMNHTLRYIYEIWTRPINLKTCDELKNTVVVRYNGNEFEKKVGVK